MESHLGLFPLNAVLMPGAALRLHIFEDRYKEMIAACIAHRRAFGVCLERKGVEVGADLDPCTVGTTAVIREVTKLSGGRLYISAHGAQRFRIRQLDRTKAYLRAELSYLGEPLGPADSARRLRETAQDHFKDYLQALLCVSGAELEDIALPEDAAASSYVIADALLVELTIKQRLLEAATAAERLHVELTLLDEQTRKLRALRARAQVRQAARKTPFDARFSLN